jgi:hypothetical protein
MAFEIVIEDGEIYRIIKDGKVLLINTDVVIKGVTEDKTEVLIEIRNRGLYAVTTDTLTNKHKFSSLLAPFVFLGSDRDLQCLVAALMERYKKEHKKKILVNLKDHVGRYYEQGQDFWVLKEHIAWIEQGELKLQPHRGFCLFERGEKVFFIDIRSVDDELKFGGVLPMEENKELDFPCLLDIWQSQYGLKPLSWAVLGYFVACMFMPEVLDCRGKRFFPLFAISGTTKSGKTSLLSNFYRFWGLNMVGCDYTQTSPFVETKQLCQASCFAIWRDEMRMMGHALSKETIIRSLYTRAAINKGTKDQELKSYVPKSTLLLSGEDVPIDPAVRRRIVLFELDDDWKLPPMDFDMATCQANGVVHELFWKILVKGFDKKVFKMLMERDFFSPNGDEEKVLYSALGAVFGLEAGENILKIVKTFWEKQETEGSFFSTVKKTCFTEQLIDFFFNVCISRDWFDRNAFQGNAPCAASKYVEVKNEVVRWNVGALVDVAYNLGFYRQTTISVPMAKSLLAKSLGGEKKVLRMGRRQIRGVEVPLSEYDKEETPEVYKTLVKNIKIAQDDFQNYLLPEAYVEIRQND